MTEKDTEYNISHLPNHLIDKGKWDACILSSQLPLIYATAIYLDGMCRYWDALVFGDYEAVMALPWNKKFAIKYIYSPYFVIAGGVFGKGISKELFAAFLKAIPSQYRIVDLDVNEHNFFPDLLTQLQVPFTERRNTWLSVHDNYAAIFSGYTSQAKRKIKKSVSQQFVVDRTGSVQSVIELYKQYYKGQDSVATRFDFTGMITLLSGNLSNHTKTYILSFPDGEVCAFYLLLFDDNYVYWLLGGSTKKGKDANAFYYLTDLVIKDFSNSNRIFRFEGSDKEGIHFFNRQFGGQTVLYPRIKINRLPWPLKYLK